MVSNAWSFTVYSMMIIMMMINNQTQFAGQPEKFPWSGLQLVTKGHKGPRVSQISRTLRSILAVRSNAVICTRPRLTLVLIF